MKNFAAFSLIAVATLIAFVAPPVPRAEAADVWKARLIPMADGGSVPTQQVTGLALKGWYIVQADFMFCVKPFRNDGGTQTADCSKDLVSLKGAGASPYQVGPFPMSGLFDGLAVKPFALEADGGVPINAAAGLCANGALGCLNVLQTFPPVLGTSDHP